MNRRRFRLLVAAFSALGGAVVLLLATELFPYHTVNHDEAVYLQQAAMLLDGRLFLSPPVADSFRPWFFVRDGPRLYPKYSPVPAAMFAVGELLGGFRLALAGIAAGNVVLTAAVVAEAFDRRTGLLAGAFLLASPLFLVDSSVFLPYAPTTFWNLVFALGYLRSARRDHRGYAVLAGLAVGAAFFARPYTAVLFALPFVVHACYSLWIDNSVDRVARLSLIALGGLAGVAATLAYNAAMTGSPWLFPYEAFAPRDGLGFGRREILGYAREYTPALALRANAEVAAVLFTEWVVAGPVGAMLAVVGLGESLGRPADRPASDGPSAPLPPALTDRQARAVLAGLFVSVLAGNVYFWGNLNILGSLAEQGDGLIATLGPYYHFDLLVPTAAFAAHGAVVVVDRTRSLSARTDCPRWIVAATVALGCLVLAAATGAALGPIVAENAETTAAYERAYAPFEDRRLTNAVVFLPTPYGDWLNHPFQHLRNDPDFDGAVVYAARDGPDDLAVASAYTNRTYYRYVYRGEWAPYRGASVAPALRRIEVVRGEAAIVDATFGVPDRADRISARVSTGDGVAYYALDDASTNVSLTLRVTDGTARLDGPAVAPVGANATVPVDAEDEVRLEVFVSDAAGGGFSYRVELPVRTANGTVLAISPYREACLVPDTCNGAAAPVGDTLPPAVRVETELSTSENESGQ